MIDFLECSGLDLTMVLHDENPRFSLADYFIIWNVYGVWVFCLLKEFSGEVRLGQRYSFDQHSIAMTMPSVNSP